MADTLYQDATGDRGVLGHYCLAVAARATNPRISEKATSGGVMTAIAHYLLTSGQVVGVTANRFVYGPPGPRTESYIAYNLEALLNAQGSKYCPTRTNSLVPACRASGKPHLFVGTPCQIGALRLAMHEDPFLAAVFPYTMTHFCGGYRDFRHLDTMIRYDGLDPADVTGFRFRGDGQPGSMKIRMSDGRTVTAGYPQYLGRSVLPKQKRCVYCVDATGELADIACGDAWIDRFLQTGTSWSIVLARSETSAALIRQMAKDGLIETKDVSAQEILQSQRKNIESKRTRQYKRLRLSHALGIVTPAWDVDLDTRGGNYLHELKVLAGKSRPGRWWIQQRRRKSQHSNTKRAS
jgi:coenzyme F420 hydrogenase subunit beta